ncbi:uncharacterized protein LOC128599160 isoform X2 [Ictalurus furcatus]|uniref:uncharacterized protein LOC128599160 isoform X2 n=1 Tax=Ictalurus furcatus TaxID=66913 RepID=UPI00235050DC|nr:uncharacterized protein LOC128599160 isoform X2 [Ictalurus furcatus]
MKEKRCVYLRKSSSEEKANNYHCPNSHVNVSWARQYKNASLHNQTAIVLEQISRPRPLGSDWLGFQLYFTAMNSAVGFLILILSCNGFSTGLNIQYSGTVVTLTNNTEVTAAVVRVDGVPVFSYPSITTVKKREIICQSMRQHVEGHLRDLQFFLSTVMKDFHYTEVSVQSEFACDGDDGYMKISYDNISITFHCKNEAWTPSNDQATALLNSLDPDYARNGKNILHDECSYWDKQRKDGGPIGGSDGGPIGGSGGISGGLIGCCILTIACIAAIFICCKKKKKKRNSVITPETIELSAEVSPMIGEV